MTCSGVGCKPGRLLIVEGQLWGPKGGWQAYPLVGDVSNAAVALEAEGLGDLELTRRRDIETDPRLGCKEYLFAGDGHDLAIPRQHNPTVLFIRL